MEAMRLRLGGTLLLGQTSRDRVPLKAAIVPEGGDSDCGDVTKIKATGWMKGAEGWQLVSRAG